MSQTPPPPPPMPISDEDNTTYAYLCRLATHNRQVPHAQFIHNALVPRVILGRTRGGRFVAAVVNDLINGEIEFLVRSKEGSTRIEAMQQVIYELEMRGGISLQAIEGMTVQYMRGGWGERRV